MIFKQKSFGYDFAVLTGAVGTYNMPLYLPSNSLVTKCWIKTDTNITSGGGATIAINAGSTAIVAAALYSTYPTIGLSTNMILGTISGTANLVSGAVTGTAQENAEFIAVSGQVNMVIAVSALTAGKFWAILEWYENYNIIP
jgi:hypothetical protein